MSTTGLKNRIENKYLSTKNRINKPFFTHHKTPQKHKNNIGKEIQHENDYIGQFIDERLILLDPTDKHAQKLTVKDLRLNYSYWANDMGIKPMGAKLFKEELKKHNVMIFVSNKQDAVRGALKTDEFPTEN